MVDIKLEISDPKKFIFFRFDKKTTFKAYAHEIK
jgi:hypothetical protein